MSQLYGRIKKYDTHLIFSYLILVIGLSFFVLRQYELLKYILWGDESETIVAARMMASGIALYSEMFNHHGPLTFLPGYILEQFGHFSISEHRMLIVLMQWLMLYVIYSSQLINNLFVKICLLLGTAYYMVMFLPDIGGHTYVYQVLAGILVFILVVKYILPIVYNPETVSRQQIIITNILIASLPFLAIPYLLTAILLFLAISNRVNYKYNLFYFVLGILLNIIFLSLIGSISGYIADHLYMNMSVLPEYNEGNVAIGKIAKNIFFFLTYDLVGFLIFLFFSAILIKATTFNNRKILVATVFILLAILSLSFRATTGFHALPFYYAILATPFMLLFQYKEPVKTTQIALFIILIPLLINLSPIAWISRTDKDTLRRERIPYIPGLPNIPRTTEFAELVKQITRADEKIIVYTFSSHEYIYSDRLPASGNFFYFPWQEKYNEKPVLGIKIDSCQDIKNNPPKIMYINKWKIWGKFSWESYAGCIQEILDKDYFKIAGKPFYARLDQKKIIENFYPTFDAMNNHNELTVIQEIDSTPTRVNHVKTIKKGQFKVLHNDPHIVYDIAQHHLSGKDIEFLSFDFICGGQTFRPSLSVYWVADDYPFSGARMLNFKVQNGRVTVPVGVSPFWKTLEHLKQIRINLQNSNACQTFSLNNINLSHRHLDAQ